MATYWRNADAEGLGKDLIAKYHQHLEEAKISYLFTDAQMKLCGQPGLAKARRANDLLKYISGTDIFLLFQDQQWSGLTPAQRTALVDQELSRCVAHVEEGEDPSWKVVPVSWESLLAVIGRHGFWCQPIKDFAAGIATQMDLWTEGQGGGSR
jgi:hypothetical protein